MRIPAQVKNKYPTHCPICGPEHALVPQRLRSVFYLECDKEEQEWHYVYNWSYKNNAGFEERFELINSEDEIRHFLLYKTISKANNTKRYYHINFCPGIEISELFYDNLYKLFNQKAFDKIKKMIMLL